MKQFVRAKTPIVKASLVLFVASICSAAIYAATIITTPCGNRRSRVARGHGAISCHDSSVTVKNNTSYALTNCNKNTLPRGNPLVHFKEAATASLPVIKTAIAQPHISVQLQLASDINNKSVADSFSVYFFDQYSSSICHGVSYKLTNRHENIAVVRNGEILSIEGRQLVAGTDTVAMKMWHLSRFHYNLSINKSNFGNDVEAYLHDAYLHSSSLLGDGENLVPFKITSDAASVAPDRFTIILKTVAALPLTLTDGKALGKNKGAEVDWTLESESSVDEAGIKK
jgi:hypothetical protein